MFRLISETAYISAGGKTNLGLNPNARSADIISASFSFKCIYFLGPLRIVILELHCTSVWIDFRL